MAGKKESFTQMGGRCGPRRLGGNTEEEEEVDEPPDGVSYLSHPSKVMIQYFRYTLVPNMTRLQTELGLLLGLQLRTDIELSDSFGGYRGGAWPPVDGRERGPVITPRRYGSRVVLLHSLSLIILIHTLTATRMLGRRGFV